MAYYEFDKQDTAEKLRAKIFNELEELSNDEFTAYIPYIIAFISFLKYERNQEISPTQQ